MDNEKLIATIQKLMNKTVANGCTQEEAASAMTKVQSLLAQHNLDMSQVELTADTTRAAQTHDRSAMYKYQQDLMRQVARNNFCLPMIQSVVKQSFGKERKTKCHVLMGRKVNILASFLMYDYLVSTFDDLSPHQGSEKRGKEALKWLAGAASSVCRRLLERRYEDEAALRPGSVAPTDSGGTSLTLTSLYSSEEQLNNDAMTGRAPGTTARLQAEREALSLVRDARIKALMADDGMTWYQAWHVAHGQEKPTQAQEAAYYRPRVSRATGRSRVSNADRSHQQLLNSSAYREGQAAGNDIGLDKQIDRTAYHKISA